MDVDAHTLEMMTIPDALSEPIGTVNLDLLAIGLADALAGRLAPDRTEASDGWPMGRIPFAPVVVVDVDAFAESTLVRSSVPSAAVDAMN